MDPIIDEIRRVKRGEVIREAVMRRWQTHLTEVVQPQLDELAVLKAERDARKASRKSAEVNA